MRNLEDDYAEKGSARWNELFGDVEGPENSEVASKDLGSIDALMKVQ